MFYTPFNWRCIVPCSLQATYIQSFYLNRNAFIKDIRVKCAFNKIRWCAHLNHESLYTKHMLPYRRVIIVFLCAHGQAHTWTWTVPYSPRYHMGHIWIDFQCASYQIHKIAVCTCAGIAGNVIPATDFKEKQLVSDPGMHLGTCVTHVPRCMSGSPTRGGGENVPGIPGANRNFMYLARGSWICIVLWLHTSNQSIGIIYNNHNCGCLFPAWNGEYFALFLFLLPYHYLRRRGRHYANRRTMVYLLSYSL